MYVKFLSAKAIAFFDTRALRSEYNRFYHKGNKDWWKTIFQIIRPILSGNSRVQQGIGLYICNENRVKLLKTITDKEAHEHFQKNYRE